MKPFAAVAALALALVAPAAGAQDKVIKVGALKLIHSITPYFYEKFTPAGYRIEVGEVEGKSLLDAMRDGKLDGMQDFDTVIKGLIESKIVSVEDGLAFATNQNNLLLSLKGMTAAEDFIRRDHMPSNAFSDSGSMLGLIE